MLKEKYISPTTSFRTIIQQEHLLVGSPSAEGGDIGGSGGGGEGGNQEDFVKVQVGFDDDVFKEDTWNY